MKTALAILIALFATSCGHKVYVPIKVSCPPHPVMEKVRTVDGTVSGKDLDNAIENFGKLWKHIHQIETLGCTK